MANHWDIYCVRRRVDDFLEGKEVGGKISSTYKYLFCKTSIYTLILKFITLQLCIVKIKRFNQTKEEAEKP